MPRLLWRSWGGVRFLMSEVPLYSISYHTIRVWGTGNDDVGLIQSTRAPSLAEPMLRKPGCRKAHNLAHLKARLTGVPPEVALVACHHLEPQLRVELDVARLLVKAEEFSI